MYNSDTEVVFPSRVIATLRTLHGEGWRSLIDHVRSADSAPAERYAFVLMMVRMCGCAGCNADSFRAMRGCTACARQAARRFKGSDQEFVEQYRSVVREVEVYLEKVQAGGLEASGTGAASPAPMDDLIEEDEMDYDDGGDLADGALLDGDPFDDDDLEED